MPPSALFVGPQDERHPQLSLSGSARDPLHHAHVLVVDVVLDAVVPAGPATTAAAIQTAHSNVRILCFFMFFLEILFFLDFLEEIN